MLYLIYLIYPISDNLWYSKKLQTYHSLNSDKTSEKQEENILSFVTTYNPNNPAIFTLMNNTK